MVANPDITTTKQNNQAHIQTNKEAHEGRDGLYILWIRWRSVQARTDLEPMVVLLACPPPPQTPLAVDTFALASYSFSSSSLLGILIRVFVFLLLCFYSPTGVIGV